MNCKDFVENGLNLEDSVQVAGLLANAGMDAIELAKSYRQSGDETSAQAALQMALNLARQLEDPGSFNPLINGLVGLKIENRVLETFDPSLPYGDTGQTVQSRLDEMKDYRKNLQALVARAWPLLENSLEQDMLGYFDRTKAFGELSAIHWIIEKHSPAAGQSEMQKPLTGPAALPIW